MITFVKKIKSKDGVNAIDLDKIKKGIPAIYKVIDNAPTITYTANHVVVAYNCQEQKQRVQVNAKTKPAAKSVKK